MGVPLLNFEQFLKSIGEIPLFLEVHLVEFPGVVNPEEIGYLIQPFLPGPLQLIKDIFDSFDVLDFFVLRYFTVSYLAVQNVIVFLFGVEKRLNLGNVLG